MAKTLQTEKNLPVHQMQCFANLDFIAVVGARTRTWDISLGGATRTFRSDKGNQYMFINQGLLQLRLFPSATSDLKIQRILVVFQHGYTSADIQRINEYTAQLNARIVYVKTVDELIQFINQRVEKKRAIKKLIFFSHGLVGRISLRYEGDDVASGEFTKASVNQVNKLAFDYDAEVISYACRTGIGEDGNSFNNSVEAQPEKSLAQDMANQWMITVKAFERRSLYAKTYGTGTEIQKTKESKGILEEYKQKNDLYKQGKSKDKPQKPPNYDLLKERFDAIVTRDNNAQGDDGPIMPLGAWHLPTSGATPTGLKHGLQTYCFKAK
ncbi:hypothetical protein Acal02_01527 [Acinetobacter calcoaceticus]